jgi:hypothetical protein
MTNLLGEWDRLVESAAVMVFIVTAFALMFGIVKPSAAFKHLGVSLTMVILLIILPAAIVNTWLAISFWQQIGVLAVLVAGCAIALSQCKGTHKKKERRATR